MFCARSQNAAHRMNTASPSTVCPLRSRRRVLCAMVKVTVSPLCSGFAVILPASVSVGSPAMGSWSPYFFYVNIFSITSIYEEKACRISIRTEEKNLIPIRHTPFSRMGSLHYGVMSPSRFLSYQRDRLTGGYASSNQPERERYQLRRGPRPTGASGCRHQWRRDPSP